MRRARWTAVRDAVGAPAGVRMAIERGLFPGPRMQVAVTPLSQTGGHTDLHYACGVSLTPPLPDVPCPVVDGVEPMRRRVREGGRRGGARGNLWPPAGRALPDRLAAQPPVPL